MILLKQITEVYGYEMAFGVIICSHYLPLIVLREEDRLDKLNMLKEMLFITFDCYVRFTHDN